MLTLFLSTSVFAQQFEFSSSLNPVGSGARATGMGGAFIGVADDATAASWNPAGLIQLEKPEVSFVYANFSREQTYNSTSHPEVNTTNTMSDNGINYMSAVFKPFVLLDHNVVMSINYQRLYEMNKKVSFPYSSYDYVQMQQTGYLYALSPAVAVQVNPKFSLGATLNFWKDYLGSNGWNQYSHSFSTSLGNFDTQTRTTVAFDGINMNFGFLWNALSNVSIGGVVKTPFDAKITQTSMTVVQNGLPTDNSSTVRQSTMSMPLSYGVGVQYRPKDSFVLALDVYQTKWSDFWITNASGKKINPLDGSTNSLKDTTQARLGVEYLMIGNARTVALRCGLFSDPEPATGKTDAYRGLSLGAGYSTKQYALDASYQYRTGNDVTSDIPALPDNKMDVTQQTIMASMIWYF